MKDTTPRFSDRAEDYASYRPEYARAILPFLEDRYGLKAGSVVADVGSGTSILSSMFLENGNLAA